MDDSAVNGKRVLTTYLNKMRGAVMRRLQRATCESYENGIGMGGRADERTDSVHSGVKASVYRL
jgi:hypothetical protein